MFRLIIVSLCLCLSLLFSPPALAQDQSIPNFTKEEIQAGEKVAQEAFEATQQGDLAKAESLWTQLLPKFANNPAVWNNRGNIRLSLNKVDEAIADFNEAIKIIPSEIYPYLSRGIGYEMQGKWDQAIADYNKVLEIKPNEAVAYNNRGNAQAGQGHWQEAIKDYEKAVNLDENFAFAQGNLAIALYQVGEEERAIYLMKDLVKDFPMFADMRAALSAVLWETGKEGEAQSNWVAAMGLDQRYQDLNWVKNSRRWSPKLVTALEKFLENQSIK
jgi:tetratricopeptide (TPR) repeat protein